MSESPNPPKRGPNALAADCERLLPELIARRDAAETKCERKELSRRIKSVRIILGWCKTRAGYVAASG